MRPTTVRPAARAARLRGVLLVAAFAARTADAASLNVAMGVAEPAGVARKQAPVATGVPLPAGLLRDAGSARVTVGDRALPAQLTPLEQWPDGSLRWVLVETLVDVGARGTVAPTLRAGAPPRPATGPRVTLTRDVRGLQLDTGAIRALVPSRGDVLLAEVRSGDAVLATDVRLPRLDVGRGPEAPVMDGPPEVETEGPVRTELLLRGRYPGGVLLEARLAAFAGSSALRLETTLVQAAAEPWLRLRAMPLVLGGTMLRGAFGIGGRTESIAPVDAPHVLDQPDADDATLDAEPAGPGDGWARAATATAALTVVVPRFRQEYPKALVLAPDGVTADLVAAARDPLPFGRGAAKTITAWLAFEPAKGATDPATLSRALLAPLVGHAPSSWAVASGALPQALDPAAPGARAFLDKLTSAYLRYVARGRFERWDDGDPVPCEQRTRERPRTGFTGLFNWGDWNFPGYRDRAEGDCDAWGNLEYDLTQVLGLAWVATGDRRFWDGFVDAARHYRDVDVIHVDPEHPDRVGLNHPHKAGHFASESKKNVDLGHVWAEGLVTHWRLTGERRSRAAAVAMGDALAGRLRKAGNPRHFGWPMIALASIAGSTNEPRFRDAALRFAAGARGAYEPTPAAADWKIGILADGLAAVQAVAPDAATLDWLTRYTAAWLPERTRFADPRYALPAGWLAATERNAAWAAAARDVAAHLDVGDWGKTLALGGRIGFRLLGPLARTPAPAVTPPARGGPPPASERARPRPSPSRAAPAPRTGR